MFVKSIVLNFLLSVGIFFVSFYFAWHISAATNFFYSTWYEVINIDETIATYAPNNKNKQGFENTSKQEQVQLFSGIVSGIQNDGSGLSELKYSNLNNQTIDTLLTEAEIIHLQDVANLVNKFKYLFIFGIILSLFVMLISKKIGLSLTKLKYHLFGGLGCILIIVLLILMLGPTKVFYVGHELIFPINHQWFFYYEDSLMSTMMKAPVLFGPIASQLLLVTIFIWVGILATLKKFNG